MIANKNSDENLDDILTNASIQMQKAIVSIQHELSTIQTGRASPELVEDIMIDYYGTSTKLKELASISVPEAQLIVLQPWDKNSIQDIEKSILKTDLGLNPANDGTVIRIPIPHLSQERRETLAKLLKRKAEDGKIRIRNVRRDFLEKIRNLERAKNVSQDDSRRGQSKLQTITDDHIDRAEELSNAKESEILQL